MLYAKSFPVLILLETSPCLVQVDEMVISSSLQ